VAHNVSEREREREREETNKGNRRKECVKK